MNKSPLKLLLLSFAAAATPASAQVDAIPDPSQDFYTQSQPRRAPDFRKKETSQAPNSAPVLDAPREESTKPATKTNNDLDDAMSVTDNGPRPAPDRNSATSADRNLLPTADDPTATGSGAPPAVTHPELMPRPPIPTPPAVTLMPPMNGGQVKESLAWRTRAYRMRAESPNIKGGLVKSSRLLNAGFDDTLATVTNICAARGIIIDSTFGAAGQLLAHYNDGGSEPSKFIISIKPISKTSTLVRIGLDADSRARQSNFDELLNGVEASINEKGLL